MKTLKTIIAWFRSLQRMVRPLRCADCDGPIGEDCGPPDGWQLEDERTVCQACCATDLKRMVWRAKNWPNDEAHAPRDEKGGLK